jgi:hypothetical protein
MSEAEREQPVSDPPLHAQPGSLPDTTPAAATGTGEDGSPPPVAAAEGAPRRRGTRRRAAILAGITFLVLVGLFLVAPTAWVVWHDRDHRIAIPRRVAGLSLDENPAAHDTVDQLRRTLETSVSLESTTGAIYADDNGGSRSVLFVGGTGALSSAEVSLDRALKAVTEDTGGIDRARRVPPGRLGGVMKCGVTRAGPGITTVCGWAEPRSLGVAVFTNQTLDPSAELLRKMRAAMQGGA